MHPILVSALDVAGWAERVDAQATLPRLIRQLIRASGAEIEKLAFPAEEGTQLGGWDGIVVASRGSEAVPTGQSVWELSTSSDPKRKAENDYQKRSEEPTGVSPSENVYVCLTAQRWPNKGIWSREKEADGIWRGVRAYDAEDIAQWLEAAPAVHIWFASLLGKYIEGARDFSTAWTEWSESTEPATIPDLVIGGRNDAVQKIHTWLSRPPSAFALQADSPEEAIAFFLAAITQVPDKDQLTSISRGIVVSDHRIWPTFAVSASL
jgi:hypothetical protein